MTTTGGNIQTVPVGKIVTRPDLFQFRDDAGGYDKTTVDTLARTWDWNRYDPVSVVRDPETGEVIVIGGHHRYESIRPPARGKPGAGRRSRAGARGCRRISGRRLGKSKPTCSARPFCPTTRSAGTSLLADYRSGQKVRSGGTVGQRDRRRHERTADQQDPGPVGLWRAAPGGSPVRADRAGLLPGGRRAGPCGQARDVAGRSGRTAAVCSATTTTRRARCRPAPWSRT